MRVSPATSALKWIGAFTGLAAAALVALNIEGSGWGFAIFLVSSLCWLAAGVATFDRPLVFLSIGYTAINLIGI